MKRITLATLVLLAACTNENESLVRTELEKSMNLSKSNLEIDRIEIGEKIAATADHKQGLALMGIKDSWSMPLTVQFKVKEDCIAVAEAIKNDLMFGERKVSCRSTAGAQKPDTKYVKGYKMQGFGRQIAVYEEGKLIKAGSTFVAKGELINLTTFKDVSRTGPVFKTLD